MTCVYINVPMNARIDTLCLSMFLGPFRYLDVHGAGQLVDKMRTLENHYGATFTPCELLLDHAKDPSKKFHKS